MWEKHMVHTHEKAFSPKLLSFSNNLFFDAGGTYINSPGIWKHDLNIRFWIEKKTKSQIVILIKYEHNAFFWVESFLTCQI